MWRKLWRKLSNVIPNVHFSMYILFMFPPDGSVAIKKNKLLKDVLLLTWKLTSECSHFVSDIRIN